MSIQLSHSLQETFSERYLIEAEIGRGGSAVVYRARDLLHERVVAVKVLLPELATSPQRFLREIRILSGLQHPNIMPLFDSGEADGVPYFVMPYIAGESLRHRLAGGAALPVRDADDITRAVADALSYAHGRGFVHRDVKPENILLCEGRPILTDFGIARAIEQSLHGKITGTGYRVGTPKYMSPEQVFGDVELDGRSDEYSLAIVHLEMLRGSLPTGESLLPVAKFSSSEGRLRDLLCRRRDVPPSTLRALQRALASSREDRFRDVREFARALVDDNRSPRSTRLLWRSSAAVTGVVVTAWTLLVLGRARPLATSSHAIGDLDPSRIAVLYFDDHSIDQGLGYLASGLTESLISDLSAVHGIQVVSRNGVKRFRNVARPTEEIARSLHAGSIVEGSVQRSNKNVRVTVQLIDGASDTHIESATVEHPTGELFALEDGVTHEVAALLRRRIGNEIRLRERKRSTHNERARELMLRADDARNQAETAVAASDTLGWSSAVASLDRADSLLGSAQVADPHWLDATIERGWVEFELATLQSGDTRDVYFRRAVNRADRVLAQDRRSAAALELRGTALYAAATRLPLDDSSFSNRLTLAQADLERAVSLDSSRAVAWGSLSRVRIARGDVSQAEHDARIALTMDSYLRDAPDILLSLYAATLMRDSVPAAWRWCERGASDYPRDVRFVECRLTLLAEDDSRRPDPARTDSLLAEGDSLDPVEHARAAGRPWLPIYRQMMDADVHARAHDVRRARAIAARARSLIQDDPELIIDLKYEQAYLALILGERRAAISLLGQYLASRPSLRQLVARHPRWRSLRGDPAFHAILGEQNSSAMSSPRHPIE